MSALLPKNAPGFAYPLSTDAMQFSLLSPDEIRALSVVEITEPQQFENGRPVANGPFDLRMGTITRQLDCATCFRNREECPGHMGHIELHTPVLHPLYIDNICQVLNSVCHNCSELLFVKDEKFLRALRKKTNPAARAKMIATQIKDRPVRVCGYCGFSNSNALAMRLDSESGKQPRAAKRILFKTRRGDQGSTSAGATGKRHAGGIARPTTVVQGSGSLHETVASEFSVAVETMPTLDELLQAKQSRSSAGSSAAQPAVDDIGTQKCLTIQPIIVRENTTFFQVWPKASALYSFLLNGSAEHRGEDEPNEPDDTVDAEEHGGDDDDALSADANGKRKRAATKSGSRETKQRTSGSANAADANVAALADKDAQSASAPQEKKKPTKRKRVLIQDATVSDVKRLLRKSPFKLPNGAEPGERVPLSATAALGILNRISPETSYLLGYDPLYIHPSWFIWTVMPVMPPCARPLALANPRGGGGGGGSGHMQLDDISWKIVEIVKKNKSVGKQNAYRDSNYENHQDLLTFHVMTLLDNNLRGQPISRRTPKAPPTAALKDELKGKGGRIRFNMLGKRVDFSSRAVITPDPTLRTDQLGVPEKLARILTIPVVVNRFNIKWLQAAVNRGPEAYRNGANFVRTEDGRTYNLKIRRNITLRIGYTVERHLVDGDIVVFNRQPSLHKMSMMGHRAVLLPGNTYRLALPPTGPYNADFDGDEMNGHIVQTLPATVEVATTFMVPSQIITPQRNAPCMGLVQDSLLAVRLFTQRDTFLTRSQIFQLLMSARANDNCESTRKQLAARMPRGRLPMPAILRPVPLWTGKQFFSLFMPPDLHYSRRSRVYDELSHRLETLEQEDATKARHCDPSDTWVDVCNGQLLSGIIDKKSIGSSGGSIVHIVNNVYGGVHTIDMLDALQRSLNTWVTARGFSVGIGDMVLKQSEQEAVDEMLQKARDAVTQLGSDLQNGRIKETPGKSVADAHEEAVNAALNGCRNEIGNYVQRALPISNSVSSMRTAGSKGNRTNAASMAGSVGQNNVNGKRVGNTYYGRTTPHAIPNDPSDIVGHGFVANSYVKGLTAREFFCHAMGGREGLVDTACKTSETGYIQRKYINLLCDDTVAYDGTVRNAAGNIVQMLYGEDGMDAIAMERQRFTLLAMSNADLVRRYYVGPAVSASRLQSDAFPRQSIEDCSDLLAGVSLEATAPLDSQRTSEALRELRFIADSRDYLRYRVFTNEQRDYLYLPKNLARTVQRARTRFMRNGNVQLLRISDAEKIRACIDRLLHKVYDRRSGPYNTDQTASGVSIFDRYNGAPNSAELLASIFIHYYLSPKRVVCEHQLSLEALEFVCRDYANDFFTARVQPGEAVGTIAAQCMGEQSTQMTLNTFHLAGVSDSALGLLRLKEITAVSKSISTPIMYIRLLKASRKNTRGAIASLDTQKQLTLSVAQKLAAHLPELTLEQLALNIAIVRDESPFALAHNSLGDESDFEHDRDFMRAATAADPHVAEQSLRVSEWGIRIALSRMRLTERSCTPLYVASVLRRHLGDVALVIASSDNDWPADSLCNEKLTADACGGIVRVLLYREPIEERLNAQKPPSSILLDPTSLDSVSDAEWRRMCCEQFAKQFLEHCKSLILGGIEGIKAAAPTSKPCVRYCDKSGSVESGAREWIVQTHGINFAETLTMPGIDFSRTTCNHAPAIAAVLGIEAARAVLLDQLNQVLSANDCYVDYRHVALLCDTMTMSGVIMPVTRHAFKRKTAGPYTRAAFEKQDAVLFGAGAFAEYEDGRDLRSAIMMGKRIPQGTGSMFDTRLSLESTVEQPSATMDEIDRRRKEAAIIANPFGFTGDSVAKKPRLSAPVVGNDDDADEDVFYANPFGEFGQSVPSVDSTVQPLLPDYVASDQNLDVGDIIANLATLTSATAASPLQTFRPMSPSAFFQ